MESRADRLDQWLDTALRECGSVEPRPGLEGRILANLASQATAPTVQTRRWWIWAGVAIVVGLALWLDLNSRPQKTRSSVAVDARKTVPRTAQDQVQSETISPVATVTPQARHRGHSIKTTELGSTPRQDQFPSLRPLSKQEQLLLRYAREFPKEAIEMAQAQASAEAQREREELATENNFGMDSGHPSR